ncbi:YceI family protein [Kordia sp. YSTF-M3]|uniref:YceI family protein n=1 Tax=Kordia aestuariivivens TaxID=2759037 RepID=A0ABR7QBB8_9FLAO|nr:YceI family protein [Kordia aestuariivivens]MBC8755693.1 YceI family protein [Kordia aestuariivivens]
MKKIKNSVLPLIILAIIIVASGYTNNTPDLQENKSVQVLESKQNQMINMFVTHGHCSTPFAGVVHNLKVNAPIREDLGNPLENMDISFEVDPTTFKVCRGDDVTARIKTPGLFIGEHNEKIIFKSTNVYTMGLDWYQVNGTLSIKGIEKKVKLFVTGIRDSKDTMASALVIEGQMNLLDWGIDYDKIVHGRSDSVPTKWMHLNMKIEML